jgi:hypothetical protein
MCQFASVNSLRQVLRDAHLPPSLPGIGLDSNLIFSQKSYLPRSAMLNLTLDLFGESINVFEVSRDFYVFYIVLK